MTRLGLSVLEQVPVFRGSSPALAAREAVALALTAEELGYRRYWVAEHHDDPSRGCASPEVLSAFIAARTSTIRIGAGCVLLPRTSASRVAEQWSLINRLAPQRVDLGIGRGMGPAMPAASQGGDTFAEQVSDVVSALTSVAAADGSPASGPPLPWLMGSGERGALTAAFLGLPFAFAQFAHHTPRPDITRRYLSEFRGSSLCPEPTLAIAVRITCAETEQDAIRQSLAIWLPALSDSQEGAIWAHRSYPSSSDIHAHHIDPEERAAMSANPFLTITGTPDTVALTLAHLADVYESNEMVLTTTCPDYTERVRAFALLAGEVQAATQPVTARDGSASPHRAAIPN